MWLRGALVSVVMALPALPVVAQDTQTLADIRQELSVLYVDVQRLRTQLSTTGAPQTGVTGSTVLDRITSIEGELQRLTARTEELQFRVEQVVSDGTNRIGDLEFRLCELETTCDIATLGETTTLGGAVTATPTPAPAPVTGGGGQMAVGEQADFDRAKAALDAGQNAQAADAFAAFLATYPAGPLSAEAQFYRGQALSAQGQWSGAARAYLESFSSAPEGTRAPDALLSLGTALGELGQKDEACLTLGEVGARFPAAAGAIQEAAATQATLGCN